MRFRVAALALAALLSSALLTGSAMASGTVPASQFPVWRVSWSGPGDGLSSVAAISRTDAWAVGVNSHGHGYLLRWGGRHWRSRPLPAAGLLPIVVRANSPSDVWVFGAYAGSGAAFRWDGSRWHQTTLPAGGAGGDVAVAGPSDVWFVTPDCQTPPGCPAFHWDGSSWTPVALPSHFVLTGLSGSSHGNVWAAGFLQARSGAVQGRVAAYRWTGRSWSKANLPRQSGRLVSVAAVTSSNVWVVMTWTQSPRPVHWNGKRWVQLSAPPRAVDAAPPIAPFGTNGIRVGATALWNGHSWQMGPQLPNGYDIATVPGTSSAWMVGAWFARTGLTGQVRFSA